MSPTAHEINPISITFRNVAWTPGAGVGVWDGMRFQFQSGVPVPREGEILYLPTGALDTTGETRRLEAWQAGNAAYHYHRSARFPALKGSWARIDVCEVCVPVIRAPEHDPDNPA